MQQDNLLDESTTIDQEQNSYKSIATWWTEHNFHYNIVVVILGLIHGYTIHKAQEVFIDKSPLIYVLGANISYFVIGLGGDLFYRNYSQKKALKLSDKLLLHYFLMLLAVVIFIGMELSFMLQNLFDEF